MARARRAPTKTADEETLAFDLSPVASTAVAPVLASPAPVVVEEAAAVQETDAALRAAFGFTASDRSTHVFGPLTGEGKGGWDTVEVDGKKRARLTVIAFPGGAADDPDGVGRKRALRYLDWGLEIPFSIVDVAKSYARIVGRSRSPAEESQVVEQIKERLTVARALGKQGEALDQVLEEIRRQAEEDFRTQLTSRQLSTWRALHVLFNRELDPTARRNANGVEETSDGALHWTVYFQDLCDLLYTRQPDRQRHRQRNIDAVRDDLRWFTEGPMQVFMHLVHVGRSEAEPSFAVRASGRPLAFLTEYRNTERTRGVRGGQRETLLGWRVSIPGPARELWYHPRGWGNWVDLHYLRHAVAVSHPLSNALQDWLEQQLVMTRNANDGALRRTLGVALRGAGYMAAYERHVVQGTRQRRSEWLGELWTDLRYLATDKVERGVWAECRLGDVDLAAPGVQRPRGDLLERVLVVRAGREHPITRRWRRPLRDTTPATRIEAAPAGAMALGAGDETDPDQRGGQFPSLAVGKTV